MPGIRSGGGDPARTLELLWRRPEAERPRRGPRPSLTVDDVVEQSVAIADRDGIDGLSMRTVARELGVSPMSLYTYVPGKAELVDLMLDRLYARMSRPPLGDRPWRRRLEAVAHSNRALFQQHPWLVSVGTARPPLGPGLMSKYEYELSAFDGVGLDDVTVDDCLTCLLTFVQAAARAGIEARDSELDTAMSDQQWWAAHAPLLRRVFDDAVYPTAARVGSAAGAAHGSAYDPEHAYAFGLARVLDGIQLLVDGAADPGAPRPHV